MSTDARLVEGACQLLPDTPGCRAGTATTSSQSATACWYWSAASAGEPISAVIGRRRLRALASSAQSGRVAGVLRQEPLVESLRVLEQCLAERMQPRLVEQPLLADAGEELIDRPASLARRRLGAIALAAGHATRPVVVPAMPATSASITATAAATAAACRRTNLAAR